MALVSRADVLQFAASSCLIALVTGPAARGNFDRRELASDHSLRQCAAFAAIHPSNAACLQVDRQTVDTLQLGRQR